MITKEVIGNELCVYRNGVLIFKRWINHDYSYVLDVMTYDKHTLVSITDQGTKKNF